MAPTPSLEDQVDKVARRLREEFSGRVSDDVVDALVAEIYAELAAAKVTQFVPVLVDRAVRQRLRVTATAA